MEIKAIGLKNNPEIEKFYGTYGVSSEPALANEFDHRKAVLPDCDNYVVVASREPVVELHVWCDPDDAAALNRAIVAYLNSETTVDQVYRDMENGVINIMAAAFAAAKQFVSGETGAVRYFTSRTIETLYSSAVNTVVNTGSEEHIHIVRNSTFKKIIFSKSHVIRVFRYAMMLADVDSGIRTKVVDCLEHRENFVF